MAKRHRIDIYLLTDSVSPTLASTAAGGEAREPDPNGAGSDCHICERRHRSRDVEYPGKDVVEFLVRSGPLTTGADAATNPTPSGTTRVALRATRPTPRNRRVIPFQAVLSTVRTMRVRVV